MPDSNKAKGKPRPPGYFIARRIWDAKSQIIFYAPGRENAFGELCGAFESFL